MSTPALAVEKNSLAGPVAAGVPGSASSSGDKRFAGESVTLKELRIDCDTEKKVRPTCQFPSDHTHIP